MSELYEPSAPAADLAAADDNDPPPSYAEAVGLTGDTVSVPPPARDSTPVPPPAAPSEWQPPPQPTPADTSSDTEAAVDAGDPPPSYDSMFGHVKQAREASSGCWDFLTLLLAPFGCLAGIVGLVAAVALLLGMPVTLVVVGYQFLNACPLAEGIPIWMIIGGVVMVVNIGYMIKSDDLSTCVCLLMLVFYLGWYIGGAVIIYPLAWPPYEPSEPYDTNYCNQILYITAFVIVNIWATIIGLLCCVMVV